jgi:hypothetical protein
MIKKQNCYRFYFRDWDEDEHQSRIISSQLALSFYFFTKTNAIKVIMCNTNYVHFNLTNNTILLPMSHPEVAHRSLPQTVFSPTVKVKVQMYNVGYKIFC